MFTFNFPTFDRDLLKTKLMHAPELERLQADGLEYETNSTDGPCAFFPIPPDVPEMADELDLLYVEKVQYGEEIGYLVAVNLLNSNLGKFFSNLDEAVRFGKSVVSNRDTLLLLRGLHPTAAEAAQSLAEAFKRAMDGDTGVGIEFIDDDDPRADEFDEMARQRMEELRSQKLKANAIKRTQRKH